MNQEIYKNHPLVKQALTCSSYAEKNNIPDNRAMATIGDKLLSFLFLEYVSAGDTKYSMEELTNMNELIQDNKIQNKIGSIIFVETLKPFSSNNDLTSKKAYATCLEAYVYALYKIDGLETAMSFIKNSIILLMKTKEVLKFINDLISKRDQENGKNWNKVWIDFQHFLSIQ